MVGWQPGCECFGRFVGEVVTVPCRVIDAASDKNNQRIEQGLHSTKSTLATFRSADVHEEETRKTVTRYISDLPLGKHPLRPCIVLDPFVGSGTTCIVSSKHGRWCWGIDLSKQYLDANAKPRIMQFLHEHPKLCHLVEIVQQSKAAVAIKTRNMVNRK